MPRSLPLVILLGFGFGLLFPFPVSAWSLKTHLWIGQQVLNDALDDGRVELAGNSYEVVPQILNAMRSNPNQYRMGNLGPDVFPDPIVGQMTTHPGVMNGWQTDDWLRQLVEHASSPSDIAFSYGFVAHAAADVFAHSYVNALAGDVFRLDDGEREVERRHFLLEKYIESLTPEIMDAAGNSIKLETSLEVPAQFLRDTLILNENVATQNFKTGPHLTAMYHVRNGVMNAKNEIQNLIGDITAFGAKYFKRQSELQINLATGKIELEIAKTSLADAESLLAIKNGITKSALDAMNTANNLINDYPELMNYQLGLITEQMKAAVEAVNIATKINETATNKIKELNQQISGLRSEIQTKPCDLLIIPRLVKECKNTVNSLNDSISNLEGNISELNVLVEAADKAAEIAQANVDGTKHTIDDLKKRHAEAVLGIAQGTYQTAVNVAKLEQQAEEKIVVSAHKALEELSKIQVHVASELYKLTSIIDDIEKTIDNYNGITFLFDNWLDDIDQATAKYIVASRQAGIKMLLSQGNPLVDFTDWYTCYGSVYTAEFIEIGEATCLVKNHLEDINQKIDATISDLPEILQWLILPSQTAKRKIIAKLNPELRKAGLEIIGFLTDTTTKDFLDLLSDPKNANRDRLIGAFRGDTSGKKLLRFDNVASVVDTDVGLSKNKLDPTAFSALKSAVVLAKLSLLQPEALNKLIEDKVGTNYISPKYGKPIYPSYGTNFSILFGAIRSIDGNQQWQAHGLPYARNLSSPAFGPGHYNYGYDYWHNRNVGLRIWVDPYLRDKVFLKLFPEGVLGSSRKRNDFNLPLYRFPECPFNPFPSTQSAFTGEILSADHLCNKAPNPDTPAVAFDTSSSEEYAKLYLHCSTSETQGRYWTFIASFRSEKGAKNYSRLLEKRYPDLKTALWLPMRAKGHWGVLLASCTTKDKAIAAMALALRRGIAADTFIWMSNKVGWKDRTTISPTNALQ